MPAILAPYDQPHAGRGGVAEVIGGPGRRLHSDVSSGGLPLDVSPAVAGGG
jgi:hypothetical protein